MVDQRAVEAVARAMYFEHVDLHGYPNGLPTWDELPEERPGRIDPMTKAHWRWLAQAALAAARPIIIEQAAGICEDRIPMPGNIRQTHGTYAEGCFDCAQAIRTAGSKTDD